MKLRSKIYKKIAFFFFKKFQKLNKKRLFFSEEFSDARLYAIFAVNIEEPWYAAIQQLLTDSLNQSRTYSEATKFTNQPGTMAYYCGGAAHISAVKERFELLRQLATTKSRS
jgi:hypothetical protein